MSTLIHFRLKTQLYDPFSKSFPSTVKRSRIIFTVHTGTGNDVIKLNQPSHDNRGKLERRTYVDHDVSFSFSKSSISAMFTTTGKWCFQKFPLWEAFPERCILDDENAGLVWTESQNG